MARPRGGDWLEDEISLLYERGIEVIVSLLEASEVDELELQQESACCESQGILFLSFPIPDYGTPSSRNATIRFVEQLHELIQAGKSLVIHCRQGIGRSSIIAAAVLRLCGFSTEEAFHRIAVARGRSVPDTPEQRDRVAALFENKI